MNKLYKRWIIALMGIWNWWFYGQYIPIPLNNSSSWYVGVPRGNMFSLAAPGSPTLYVMDFMKYYIYNDTLINNVSYKKLYRKVYFVNGCYSGPPTTDNNCGTYMFYPHSGYVGAIRQDITARKVYFISAYMEKEVLLYDFSSHNPGDIEYIWTGEKTYNKGGPFLGYDSCSLAPFYNLHGRYLFFHQFLTSARYKGKTGRETYWEMKLNYAFEIGNNYYRVPECWVNSHWIEGVGSKTGILEHMKNDTIFHTRLYCFESNGKVRYPFSDTTKCCCDSVIKCVLYDVSTTLTPPYSPVSKCLEEKLSGNRLVQHKSPEYNLGILNSEQQGHYLFLKEINRKYLLEEIKNNPERIPEGEWEYEITDKEGQIIKRGRWRKE